MEILDTLTLIVDLFNLVTSEDGTNLIILPVRYIGKKKEKN